LRSTPAPTATPTATTPAQTGGVDLNRARQLQLQGYNARIAGDYPQAIALSQQALDACGDGGPLSPCGYAAYELGYSLNHSGRSAEAIPYLERRVAYGDGNKEAEKELKDARKRAGQ
jgi:tetratricopeptide (TPR) repeat protein